MSNSNTVEEEEEDKICLTNKMEHQFHFETEQSGKEPFNIASVLSDFVSALLLQTPFFSCSDKNTYFLSDRIERVQNNENHAQIFIQINKSLLLVSST